MLGKKSAGPPRDTALLRAHGRSLDDFGELSPPEKKLLDCARTGQLAVFGADCPEESKEDNSVRADFVRFLTLGGDERAPVHERGVRLQGACLVGPLDLMCATAQRPLLLLNSLIQQILARHSRLCVTSLEGSRLIDGFLGDGMCCEGGLYLREGFHATGEVRLVGATIDTLDCSGGRFENASGLAIDCAYATISGSVFLAEGFSATRTVSFSGAAIGRNLICHHGCFDGVQETALACDYMDIKGSVFLRFGFNASGEVRMIGATIRGELNCEEGTFENPLGDALTCDRIEVGGSVHLRHDFRAVGSVRFLGARIGGNLECQKGEFIKPQGISFGGDRMRIGGSVHLREGFSSTGEVRLANAQIGGNLDCSGGSFSNENENGDALNCEQMRVDGSLFFCRIRPEDLVGGVRLGAAHVAALSDDIESWKGANGRLTLDGFTYDRLADASPTDSKARIAWLGLQDKDHLGGDFRPQPWEQLISVLRAMGHADDARTVAVARHERMRAAGRFVGGSRLWDSLYGWLVGYGYRPWKLLGIVGAIWLLGSGAYWLAVNPQWFGGTTHLLAPPTAEPSPACLAARAAARSGDPCPPSAANYRDFFAPAYSFEVLLPAVSLGYKEGWQPVVRDEPGQPLFWGRLLYVFYWFQIIFGWLAGLLLIAALGQLVKRD